MSLQTLRRRDLKPPLRTVRPQPDMLSASHFPDATNLKTLGGRPGRPAPLRFRHRPRRRRSTAVSIPTPRPWNGTTGAGRCAARIRSLEDLARIFRLSEDERSAVERHEGALPVGITPYYASLMGLDDAREPLRRTHIMTGDEYVRLPGEGDDPLGEDHDTVAPGLVHRYPRPRAVPDHGDLLDLLPLLHPRPRRRQSGRRVPVLQGPVGAGARLSRGAHRDPRRAALGRRSADARRRPARLAARGGLRAIKHIEFVRIGTKMPTVTPQRITKSLVAILKKHHPLWMSLHFTHPNELTPEVSEATARLADAGIPLGSQTVLLKGINDTAQVMVPLMHGLLKRRVRPYYLYQCDPIRGSGHFRTTVEKGLEIIRGAARPHHRLRDADLRGRRAGRRRQDPACARSGRRPRRRRSLAQEFRGERLSLSRPGRNARQGQGGMMRIGVTYDLRADYIAMGYGEEGDGRVRQRRHHRRDLQRAGRAGLHARAHRRGSRSWSPKLAKGERYDAVFNFSEGFRGNAREAQVPCLLDAYEIPYVFSDALTLALALDKGMCKRVVRDAGVPTVDFRVIEKLADVKKIDLPFPAVPQAGPGRLGQGHRRRFQGRQRARPAPHGTEPARPASSSRCWSRPSCRAASSRSASSAPARMRPCSASPRSCRSRTGSVTATATRTRNIPTTR